MAKVKIELVLPRGATVRDAGWDESSHKRAANGEFSKSDHEAAGKHHEEQSNYHKGEAKTRGENTSKPAPGSHAEASSWHGSAALYHKRAAEEYGTSSYAGYLKSAKASSGKAFVTSRKIASGKSYPEEKENNFEREVEGKKAAQVKRVERHLRENRIRMR